MMNTTKTILTLIVFFGLTSTSAKAQFWKKITDKVNDKVVKKVEKKIDDVLEPKQDKKQPESETNSKKPLPTENPKEQTAEQPQNSVEVWRNFKFIPGENVIFYDDLQYEEVGEFPSRWDLMRGGAEVASINQEKAILFINEYDNFITPLFKNENYLGDEFTIEFDFLVNKSDERLGSSSMQIMFEKDYRFNQNTNIEIGIANSDGKINGRLEKFKLEKTNLNGFNKWHHLALSYYKGKLKLYIDAHRVLNLPNFKGKIEVFALSLGSYNKDKLLGVKNIRIAHGGGQMYKRIMADGKYITNGILFDSGKAIIKPQSMGIINKMVAVMKEQPDWKFEIVGHTDSDGDAAMNLKLSKQRAEAVKQAIVNHGISSDRLSTVGKGESEPLNLNKTKEDKANNRRVEFIKQ